MAICSTYYIMAHNLEGFTSYGLVRQGPILCQFASRDHSAMETSGSTRHQRRRNSCRSPLYPHPQLNLSTYNIQDRHGFGLLQAIRLVHLGKYDLMLLTDTKILDVVYCKNHLGCDIIFSRATPTTSGGAQRGGHHWLQCRGWRSGTLSTHTSTYQTWGSAKLSLGSIGHPSS